MQRTSLHPEEKTVKVSLDLHTELRRLGSYDETMNDIILKCVQAYKKTLKVK